MDRVDSVASSRRFLLEMRGRRNPFPIRCELNHLPTMRELEALRRCAAEVFPLVDSITHRKDYSKPDGPSVIEIRDSRIMDQNPPPFEELHPILLVH